MPGIKILKGEKIYVGSQFQRLQSTVVWPHGCEPMVSQSIMVERDTGPELMAARKQRQKGRDQG
jgi:hypothetical protein